MAALLTNGLTLWSFRREFLYVLAAFLVVLLMPFIAVLVVANVGLSFVSDTLAKTDTSTNSVQLYNPNGTEYKLIEATITWPARGIVTSEFGARKFPFIDFHTGIDIAGRFGDPVTPFMAGKVTYAGEIRKGLGKHIIVDNGDNVTSYYGHLSKIEVEKGNDVVQGQIIGRVGSSGTSTGPHLHFQLNVWGVPVNPRVFLGD